MPIILKQCFLLFLTTAILILPLSAVPAPAKAASDTPIYVSLITHNEDSTTLRYPNFVEDEDAFWEYRDALVSYADMLSAQEVKYNFQPAWTFLLATLNFDSGTSSTNGKNVLRYLVEDLGFSVNVHGHPGEYSYADAAYLIDRLGVEPSGVMGGFIASPAADSELEDLWETQEGSVYNYQWQPTALWGAATSGHSNDTAFENSGIWRPVSNSDFFDHQDSAPLPMIGGYTADWDGLDELLELQENGDLDPEVMHTASIMVDHDEMLTQAERNDIQDQIESLQDETNSGRIIWVTLEEVLSIWETDYASTPSLFSSSTHSYTSFVDAHDLIKTACLDDTGVSDPCHAVYYFDASGKRHAFTNERNFNTWYDDYNDLVTVTSDAMSDFTLGSNVTYKPGVKMVKFPSVPVVYAVSQGGVLRAISSESVATSLYGSTWNQQIDDISEAFYGNYEMGENIDSASEYDPDEEERSVSTIDDDLSGSTTTGSSVDWESNDVTAAFFALNIQDFSYPDKSADVIERVLDIHDEYNVPLDVYLTTTMVDELSENYPETFERLQSESFVSLSYHIRPPVPYHSADFDYMGLQEMSSDEQYDTIMEYETHGLDLESGEPTDEPGSYDLLKDLIGYAPIAVGASSLAGLSSEVHQVFADLGATFLVENSGTTDLGEKAGDLYLRPQHVDVKIFEYDTTDGQEILDDVLDQAADVEHDGPVFLGFKIHDNDFFAEDSAWVTVYLAPGAHIAGPPFDTSLKSDLLSDAESDEMWERYESVVAAVADDSDIVTTNMEELADVVQ